MQQGTSIIILLLTLILVVVTGFMGWIIIEAEDVDDIIWAFLAYAISVPVCAPITAEILKYKGYPVHYAWGALSLIGVFIVMQRPRNVESINEDDDDPAG